MKKILSVVIPGYNESEVLESTITSVHNGLKKHKIPHEILFVNDNSTDNTEELLKEVAQKIPTLWWINRTPPNGFGHAVKDGLNHFKGDYVAIMMADESDSVDDLVAYYKILEKGYDCAFGSRFIKGSKIYDYPKFKMFFNRLTNIVIKVLFRLPLNDVTNAFKAYRKETIEGVKPLMSHHFNLTVEIPLKAIIRGYTYAVVPISWRNRKKGVSKLKIKEMGSRYLFIVLYCYLEKLLSRGDYLKRGGKKHEGARHRSRRSHRIRDM